RLMVVDADGGAPQHLLPDLEGHVWHLDWLDDNTIVFISYEGTGTRLGTIRANGSGESTRLENGTIWASFSVAGNGDMVLIGHSPPHPEEAFRLDRRARSAQRLTDSNAWLADRRLARQEVVRYAARDGLEIEGVLIWPLDFTEGEHYPLILAV